MAGDDGANWLWFVKGFTLACVTLSEYSEDWPEPDWMMPRHQQQPGVISLVEGCFVSLAGDTQLLSGCNLVPHALR